MNKEFNITGICVPNRHYMVDISLKTKKIITLIEKGKYFSVNRPRQYGKTTTFHNLAQEIRKNENYLCFVISFEGIGSESYESSESFFNIFISLIHKNCKNQKLNIYSEFITNYGKVININDLSDFISCFANLEQKKIVLLIDEVDKSMNNQLFLDFLGMLRNKYLQAASENDTTFHSVILAGVHDVKTLKIKINPNTEFKYNSPWNIATDFDVDMSFNPQEISTMLVDYVAEKNVEMDIPAISERIYHFTSGYPFLVSRICKQIDEKILPTKKTNSWDTLDVDYAVNEILHESNTNFDSLIKHLENDKKLYSFIEKIILGNERFQFAISEPTMNLAYIYGIINQKNRQVVIHNKIYEEYITNHFTAKIHVEGKASFVTTEAVTSKYLKINGKLDFLKVLLTFQEVIREKYSKSEVLKSNEFLEKDLRLLFLVFLKPIINSIGFSFKEVETSEEKRMDIIVLFRDEKFVVELKLWRGEEYHNQGITRLKDYMHREGIGKAYMLIMDKKRTKEFVHYEEQEILMVWI